MRVTGGGTGTSAATIQPPRTEVYDVTTYTCQADDTWESVSKKFFNGDPSAAAALKEFNRNHPRADERVRTDGTTPAGVKVYVPPLRILQRHGLSLGSAPGNPAAVTGAPTTPPAPGK
jgi:hypothetical protein